MNGYTRLNDAAFFGRTDVIELLLKGGADKSIKGFNGRTPYDAAVAYNVKGTGVKIPDQVLERLRT
jgi:ankyrin repeat protein